MNIFDKCISIDYKEDSIYYLEKLRHLGCSVFLDSNASKTKERYDC